MSSGTEEGAYFREYLRACKHWGKCHECRRDCEGDNTEANYISRKIRVCSGCRHVFVPVMQIEFDLVLRHGLCLSCYMY